MSENLTAISETYPLVRAILGDFNSAARRYEDSAIRGMVRAVVRLGHVTGIGLTADQQSFSPAITDSKALAQLIYQAALKFALPRSASGSWATRGFKKSWGDEKLLIFELQNLVQEMENGALFYSFQDFYGWVHSITGINVWEVMTEMRVNAPIGTVSLGVSGISAGSVAASGAAVVDEGIAEGVGDTSRNIGPPATGDYLAGDQWTDVLGALYRCTVAGSPGTWVQFRAASITTFPVAGDTGVPAIPTNYLVTVPAQNWAQFYWNGTVWRPVYLQP